MHASHGGDFILVIKDDTNGILISKACVPDRAINADIIY